MALPHRSGSSPSSGQEARLNSPAVAAPSVQAPNSHYRPGVLPGVSSPQGNSIGSASSLRRVSLATLPSSSTSNWSGKDLWNEALEKLPKKEKALIEKYRSRDSNLMAGIVKAVQEQRTKCEAKGWEIKINDRSVALRSVADKVILWIEKFKQIGDVAVNADPLHAGLPWAGIRFLLQAAVSDKEQMSNLLTGLHKVLYLIDRCKIYEMLYLENRQATEALPNLASAMVELYAIILQFLSKAIRLFSKGTVRRALHAFLKPEDVADFVSKCETSETRVEIEAENCERSHSRLAHSRLGGYADDLKKLLKELDDSKELIARIDNRVATLWHRSNEHERSEILKWTSDIPYLDHHKLASTGRTSGTGVWLLEHDQYRDWQSSNESIILWLHGIPGAGKTKLVSKVVDSLMRQPQKKALAYFYCDRNQDSRRDLENILCTLVKQLSTSPNVDGIHNSLVQLYFQKRRSGFSSNKLTIEESESLLFELIQAYPETTVVLDALDECDRNVRGQLIEIFNRLVSKSKRLKVFISSRRDTDIKHQLERKANVGIEATDNKDDISKFVEDSINKDQLRRRLPIPDELRADIIQTLLEKSEGMFQWASLQITQLLSLERHVDIRERLGKLPKGLKAAYDDIYNAIQDEEGSKPTIAYRAFQWVMCAYVPLKPATLVAAVGQDPENGTPESDDIDLDFVLGACHNLLTFDSHLGVCRFAHLSVQEYFETHHWSSEQAHGWVAMVCLSLLNNPNNWELSRSSYGTSDEASEASDGDSEASYGASENSNGRSSELPDPAGNLANLIDYAGEWWYKHVQDHGEADIDNRVCTVLKEFLGSPNESKPAYRSWCESVSYKHIVSPPWGTTLDVLQPSTVASFAVCFFGFCAILSGWLDLGFTDVEQRNKKGESLLVLAIQGGNISIVKTLLESGADVNAQVGGKYGSALTAAAWRGKKETVQLLLNSGADVNAQVGGEYGSALAAAACNKKIDTVQLLLNSGADVNAQVGGKYGSALAAAACNENIDTVQLLLNSGADVNAQVGGEYGSALRAAAKCGREDIFQVLLEHGAKIDALEPEAASEVRELAEKFAKAAGHGETAASCVDELSDGLGE